MATSAERQPSVSKRGWFYLAVIAALLLIFGALTAYQLLTRDRFESDPEAMQRLETATLPEMERPVVGTWPQWRGPYRDGISAESGLLTQWSEDGPQVLWREKCGLGFSAISVVGPRAYTLMQADGSQEAVVCWNTNSKGGDREVWRYSYPCDFQNDQGDGPRSTPTIDGDYVYTVGAAGMLCCLKANTDKKDGELVWSHDLVKEYGARVPRWGVSFSPLVDGDLVYTCPGGADGHSLMAFNKLDGKVAWHNLDDSPGYSSPVLTAAGGKRQVLFFMGQVLLSVDSRNGHEYWRYPWKTNYECNIATPISNGNYVFISSGYGQGCVLLEMLPATDGSLTVRPVYKTNRMRNHFASSVYYQEHLYGFNDGTLTCMNFRTGEIRWREDGFRKGSLLIADGHLIILGESGKLALARATPDGYVEEASHQFKTPGRCWTPPTLADGKLYLRLTLRTDDGKEEPQVLCLKVK